MFKFYKNNGKLAHSGADQRERKMRLVVFTVLVCRWLMVCGIGRCPFPGITANSKFNSSSINWQNGTSFQEGDVVEYTCPDIWRKISGLRYSVSCRSDGTWTNHPPRCGLRLANEQLNTTFGLGSVRWTANHSCSSRIQSSIYTVQVPKHVKRIEEFTVDFCNRDELSLFRSTTLEQTRQCSSRDDRYLKIFTCNELDPKNIQHSINVHLTKDNQLDNLYLYANPGNHCGWPPVPLHSTVVTKVLPGQTTNVTYKCDDLLVLDANGPQESICDQLTGYWSELPRCTCPDPLVPANAKVGQRLPYSVRFRCADGFDLMGEDTVTCNETGTWSQFPSCQVGVYPIATGSLGLVLIVTFVIFGCCVLKLKQMFCFKSTDSPSSVSVHELNGKMEVRELRRFDQLDPSLCTSGAHAQRKLPPVPSSCIASKTRRF